MGQSKKYVLCLFCLFVGLFFSLVSQAQAVPVRLYPQIDPARAEQRLRYHTAPTLKPEIEKTTERIMPPGKIDKVRFTLKQVVIEGATIFTKEELYPLYRDYINQQVTFSDLQKIADKITVKYRNAGYIISKAVVPAQKITKGVVRIKVIEGFVGKVTIEGDAKGAAMLLKAYGSKLQQVWPPLNMKTLERYVLLAKDLPGIDVDTVLTPSKSIPGATDVTLIVSQKTFDVSADYNNFGTKYLGPYQFSATVAVNELSNTADQLGMRVVTTPDGNEMRFGQLFYNRPIGSNGLRVDLEGDYTNTHPNFKLGYLDLTGTSKSFRAKLSYPFIKSRIQNLSGDISFKVVDSNNYYPHIHGYLYQDKIRSLRAGGFYTRADSWNGFNFLSAQLSKGLPIWGATDDHPTDHPSSREGGRSDYLKFDFYASRSQVLTRRWSFLIGATGQYANHPLLAAEEFGFGGRDFGRGYDPSEIIGDKGIDGKAELRFNTFPGHQFFKYVQYYALYDIGKVWNIGDDSDQPAEVSAASAGLGARISFTNHIDGVLEIDKPLTYKVQTLVDDHKNGNALRGFFSISAFI